MEGEDAMKRRIKFKRTKIKQRKIKPIKKPPLKVNFKRKLGYDLNLASPQTFSEKIQWIKVYGKPERFSRYVDKYNVRQYVKERIGDQYLIPLIGVYNKVNQINWSQLPDSFVMKTTHGATWNIVVKDKAKVNWGNAKMRLRKWLGLRYYLITGESNYRNIKPRIVIEEFINDPTGDLKDYKFFCFQGEPAFIQVDGTRFTNHQRDLFDLDWNKIPVRLKYKNFIESPPKPARLAEMIQVARQLSEGLPFVRVDLYYTNDRIYFGELTFTPGNGFERFTPRSYDDLFGQYLDINRYI